MGDHVKVIAGRFEGDTGLIVRVEENFVILFSDLTMHEVGGGAGSRSDSSGATPRDLPLGGLQPFLSPPVEGAASGSAALLGDSLRSGRWGSA